jgi:hypothetical protein
MAGASTAKTQNPMAITGRKESEAMGQEGQKELVRSASQEIVKA